MNIAIIVSWVPCFAPKQRILDRGMIKSQTQPMNILLPVYNKASEYKVESIAIGKNPFADCLEVKSKISQANNAIPIVIKRLAESVLFVENK